MKALRPRVYTANDAAADPAIEEDNFLKKIIKYIPTEIVAAYVAIADALKPVIVPPPEGSSDPPTFDYTWLWGIFWILLVLTLPYIWFFTQEDGKPKPVFQTVVAPIAFAAWVFALGGPFTNIKATLPEASGTVVLVLVLLIIPLAEKIFLPKTPLAKNNT